ncbi:hypothetical protein [Pelomicrobium sp. G1]|uniref:hypothetical protein n=1 Tax=unclassified Pelomicrobium TaxID=2815318 RepID=UPI003F771F41
MDEPDMAADEGQHCLLGLRDSAQSRGLTAFQTPQPAPSSGGDEQGAWIGFNSSTASRSAGVTVPTYSAGNNAGQNSLNRSMAATTSRSSTSGVSRCAAANLP